ncbi:MAG: FtsQ-type POTRA domain-containing protein [Treponema sp.]|nr:FtsQ-type POTRA domain-containing protein [Treponema sp.]
MSDYGLLMSDEYNYSTERKNKTTDSTKERRNSVHTDSSEKEESSDKKIKIIKIVFFILCFFLLSELVVYKYVMPIFSSPKVTVSGQNLYSAEEIAMMLLPMNSTNWLDFDVAQAAAILCSEPGIDNAIVEKKFPDKIYIDVIERDPVALTFVMENGHSNPMQIDKNCVLFPVRNNSKVNSNIVPIISGLPVEHMSGGMRIPSKYRTLISEISEISNLGRNYFAGISEICVMPKEESGSYELALIPAQSKVRVLTDRSLNEEALKYMMVVLDVVNVLDKEVTEVDLRYGSVSCIMK